jgi:hypothetical protein
LGAYAASPRLSLRYAHGTVDLSGKYVKNDMNGSAKDHRYGLGRDGINSSQLGFAASRTWAAA